MTQQVRPIAVEELGQAFLDALVNRDFPALHALVSPDARMRLLVPRGPQEEVGAAAILGRFVGWFGDAAEAGLESSTVEAVAGRLAIGYRFTLRKPDGWRVIEQHLMADADTDHRLVAIDLLCSGFRQVPEPYGTEIHDFDAGDLGCGDGLAGEFRRAIQAIPEGDLLAVTVRDPAAKEDLPSLARMMGHSVHSIETSGDGRLQMIVERGQ